ncbi:MAG: DnaD domain protein [Bacillota bacterium]|nr:DnaD domain protein [Bacillota bacterium]
MDFEKQSIKNYFLYDTEIENLFIGEYMLDAPGDYVKVYLLGMMHAQMEEPIDNSMIAKELTLSQESVDKAWDYWQTVGLIKKVAKSESSDAYKVVFINIKEAVFGKCAIEIAGEKTVRPAIDLTSADLGQLYHGIEKVTERLLEGKEAETVASWITDFGISPDVILYCYKYSTENGKSNRVKYVEKILMDWREKNLETVDMIEEYLGESDRAFKLYKRVFKALGFDGRKPSEPEKAVMRKWFFDMNLSIDDVLAAIEKTIAGSSPSIKYVDTILSQNQKLDTPKTDAGNAYAKIQSMYERIREENLVKTKQIRERIYNQIPEIEEIMLKLKDCSARSVGAMLAKDFKLLDQIESERKQLINSKERLLKDAGYAVNALDPIFTCSKCNDTGFLDDGSTCSCYADKLEAFMNGK